MSTTFIDSIYSAGEIRDEQGQTHSIKPHSILKEEGSALYDFILKNKLKDTLEIGMASGMSTLWFCQAHADKGMGNHVAIDPGQERNYHSLGLKVVRDAGLDQYLEFMEEDSAIALPKLLESGRRFDFIFIDGMHLFDFALVDFFFADKLIPVGGYVAFHDMWMPALRKVTSYIVRNRHYEVWPLDTVSRLPLSRRFKKIGRRMLQASVDRNYSGFQFSFGSENVCLLKKTAEDTRRFNHHRLF